MSYRLIINKQKKLVDDIVSVVLVILLVFIAFAVTLLAIMSIGVYCFFVLIMYSIYRSYKGIFDRKLKTISRVLSLSFGITFIIIPSYILSYMFSRSNIPASYFVYLLCIPLFLIGLAGLLKGLIVDVYSTRFRRLNVLIGAITLLFIVFAIIFAETGVIFHLFTLLIIFTLNGILRAALYLSEYGLSLKSFRDLKLVWFLMDSPALPQPENQDKP